MAALQARRNARPAWTLAREQKLTPSEILRVLEMHHPAVDVGAIVKRLGVQVIEDSQLNTEGRLQVNGDEAIIFVRRGDSTTRQRFTVAHELGHLMLHQLERAHHRNTSQWSKTPEEFEANRFAADLLMPFEMIDPYLLRLGRTDIIELARKFEVSPQAMEIRLQMMAGIR